MSKFTDLSVGEISRGKVPRIPACGICRRRLTWSDLENISDINMQSSPNENVLDGICLMVGALSSLYVNGVIQVKYGGVDWINWFAIGLEMAAIGMLFFRHRQHKRFGKTEFAAFMTLHGWIAGAFILVALRKG